MFPTRFFNGRFFAGRYWPKVGSGATADSVGAATGMVSIFSQVTYALTEYGQVSGKVSIQSYSGSTAEVTA